MELLVEVLGVIVLGGLVGQMVARRSGAVAAVEGVTAVALAAAGLSFWGGAWSTSHTFVAQVGTYPSAPEANLAASSLFPADEKVLVPAEAVIPRSARVYLICAAGSTGCSGEWISYQFSPRLFVEHMREAEYVLVYGQPPQAVKSVAHLKPLLELPDGGVVRNAPR